jgi:hypothetical protein
MSHSVRAVCADALVRVGQPCRVLALINDSVGVLTASCYFDNATEMGVILGTGTNACIVERVRSHHKSGRQDRFVLCCTVLYCIVLCCIVLCCVVLYCIVLYCIVLYCIELYCIVLYCIVLYCTDFLVLHCTPPLHASQQHTSIQ